MTGEASGMTDLEELLERWGRREKLEPVPDLWPRLRPILASSTGREVAAIRAAGRRLAISVAAALAAAYVAGPWAYSTVPGALPRLLNWAAAAPAWLLSRWGGWWQAFLCRLVGGC